MMKVALTPDYRMTSDGTQFILQYRRMVDPTKAPNWPKRAAEGADPTPHEKWEDAGYYHAQRAWLYRCNRAGNLPNCRRV